MKFGFLRENDVYGLVFDVTDCDEETLVQLKTMLAEENPKAPVPMEVIEENPSADGKHRIIVREKHDDARPTAGEEN